MTKNVIWLTFDSIRGDRTSLGSYDRGTTPILESIGARSDGFASTCFSHAIWSKPSVASMMTGTYPAKHGLGNHNDALPQDLPTVAERFSNAGYRTAGISLNPYFSPTTGLDRGFDRFDFVSGGELAKEAGISSLVSFFRNISKFSGGLKLDKQRHSPDFLLNEIVKDRLERLEGGEDPFFFTAHYYGAHHPYYPSPHFRSKFGGDLSMSTDRAAEIAFEQTTDVYEGIARGSLEEDENREAVSAMYDAQVAQVDTLVGRLLTFIERLGIDDETIVVVTSDHGDLLGEMGLLSHKLLLHDALLEVPIAVLGSETLSDADVGLAQHADFMQTILAELGIDTDEMNSQRLDKSPREVAVAQRGGETREKTVSEVRDRQPGFDHEHAFPGFSTALRSADWKYVSAEDDIALYELPREDENVASEHQDVVRRFENRLAEWNAEHGQLVKSDEAADFDDDVQERLADLGYVTK